MGMDGVAMGLSTEQLTQLDFFFATVIVVQWRLDNLENDLRVNVKRQDLEIKVINSASSR